MFLETLLSILCFSFPQNIPCGSVILRLYKSLFRGFRLLLSDIPIINIMSLVRRTFINNCLLLFNTLLSIILHIHSSHCTCRWSLISNALCFFPFFTPTFYKRRSHRWSFWRFSRINRF